MTAFKIKKIRKRDGRLVDFDFGKIKNAIHKAIIAVKGRDGEGARKLTHRAVEILEKKFAGKIPTVENIQDIVEGVLIKSKEAKVAKAYILYRQLRTEVREAKKFVGVSDELKLSVNALAVLKKRYLLKDEKGEVIETPAELIRRAAKTVAAADRFYNKKANITKTEEEFYRMMASLEFLPNSPTLMNAGTSIGQLSACFVLPIEDSMISIFEGMKEMAIIHQSGGGTGFSFSCLRPRGDVVRTTHGVASGPVSFMTIYDEATDVIKQGGRRRGANMGILSIDHPDILEFISSKEKGDMLKNFNISVAIPDSFFKVLKAGGSFPLRNPRTEEKVGELKAKEVFNLIATQAWKTGDPGIIFIDEINRRNPTPKVGRIESTNPCGEQPLLPYESCNLGSINLTKFVKQGRLDWDRLRKAVVHAVHFLDNVIDINKYPIPEIARITKDNRKIGLGIMGFAEALIMLGIPYDSEKALKIGEEIMRFIKKEGNEASIRLGKERGSFSNFKGSLWHKKGYKYMRNATVTTIAPTGSISIIAGVSSGIEPIFAISFIRDVLEGTKLLEVNSVFERVSLEMGFYSRELMQKIAKTGTLKGIREVPAKIRKLFVTALDISPEWHVKMQAVFQRHTDNAVSKTVNLPRDSTVNDVKKIYLLAHKLKCKGITVYRYGSKPEQVLYTGYIPEEMVAPLEHVRAESEYAGGCPAIYCPY